ncbi:MAG: hypothetical protein P8130_08490, partial [Deltaproteobacteria bacterium]
RPCLIRILFLVILITQPLFTTGKPVFAQDRSNVMKMINREITKRNLRKLRDMGPQGISYIDESSIRNEKDTAFFDLYVFYPHQTKDAEKDKKSNIWKEVQTYEFKCRTGNWKIIRLVDFPQNGKIMKYLESFLLSQPYQKNIPNSESNMYYNIVCK